MKFLTKQFLIVGGFLVVSILIGGCIYIDGVNLKAKFERAEDRTVALAAGSEVVVETHNGFVVVQGADTQQCRMEAVIRVRAETEEIAQTIAEQSQIILRESSQKLVIQLEKPTTKEKHSISVDYTLTVPRQTHLNAVSHNGRLEFSHLQGNVNCQTHNGKIICNQIDGDVEAETHNGDIHCRQINGPVRLQTHNGQVDLESINAAASQIEAKSHNGQIQCKDIQGNLNAETYNGRVTVLYNRAASSRPDVRLVTYNDNIHFTGPPNLSAELEISTKNGSIHTDLPIQIRGEISKCKITGVIGDGEGRIYLHTHNGSIWIH